MKKILITLLLGTLLPTFAQKFDTAIDYLNFITGYQNDIAENSLSYTSAVAHGKTARKIEKRRKELLASVVTAKAKIKTISPFKGDNTLKDSALSYLKITYNILNEDYAKIVDMEEVAEQSYDAMEAYMLAQEIANKKRDVAGDNYHISYEAFAKKNNITLLKDKSSFNEKAIKAGKVYDYYTPIYLIFFKSYKQEMYLTDAINKKDFTAIEQNNNALKVTSEEGIAKLIATKNFMGTDNSLVQACKELLGFYKGETVKIKIMSDHMLKMENFEKIKKAYETKSQSEKTKEVIDQYNKDIQDFNKSVENYNKNNNELNQNRSNLINKWNKTSSDFLDNHTPHYNK
jgi:hypothetical protein